MSMYVKDNAKRGNVEQEDFFKFKRRRRRRRRNDGNVRAVC